MKIRGKKKTVYEPKWCCSNFENIVKNWGLFRMIEGQIQLLLGVHDEQLNREVGSPFNYCPFCGEKIEL